MDKGLKGFAALSTIENFLAVREVIACNKW